MGTNYSLSLHSIPYVLVREELLLKPDRETFTNHWCSRPQLLSTLISTQRLQSVRVHAGGDINQALSFSAARGVSGEPAVGITC